MTQPKLLDRILELPISDRWYFVQAILNSIQAETVSSDDENNELSTLAESGFSDYLSNLQDYEERLARGEIQW